MRGRCLVPALLLIASPALAKPKPPPKAETKDEAALRVERKAVDVQAGGDAAGAVRALEQAIQICDLPTPCTAKTRARLHATLGTVKGAGQNDLATAKTEFKTALTLDPEVRPSPTITTKEVNAAFEEVHGGGTATKPISVSELLHPEEHEEKPPPPPPPKEKPKPDEPAAPEPRWNWLSAGAMIDWAFLTEKNVCSPGAPSAWYCTDENGAHYTGRPQPNDDVSKGFALATMRFVLGYERVIAGGLKAGAFAGLALPFHGAPEGRSGMFPLHLEARGTYVFGQNPYADDDTQKLRPFGTVVVGLAQYDTTATIRVYEIPCQSRPSPACKYDLDAQHRVGRLFLTLGGGVRYHLEGAHALRGGMRVTLVPAFGSFFFSPEVAYEYGF